jgi:hypothetical protein
VAAIGYLTSGTPCVAAIGRQAVTTENGHTTTACDLRTAKHRALRSRASL